MKPNVADPNGRGAMKEELTKAVVNYLDTHRHCTLATIREDSSPQASTVSYVNDGLKIYFMTDPSSQKAKNIAFWPKVALAISEDFLDWDEIKAVQLAGTVEWLEAGPELSRAQKMFARKFPQVKKYLDSWSVTIEQIPFVRVSPTIINYLDYSKGFNHWDTIKL
jgi:nitroimidazol reductase NimA-like FMN-containing flavoprotein (pyridoxamine 5'-phosphate oxidase superfamily)